MKLTILTPTYNRGYILRRLYESLISQTDKEFEWLIIDDGSNDNTEILVDDFIKCNEIKIRYIKQSNGGKHRALNTGISVIDSELTFIVDSDDYLLPYAVEEIFKIHKVYASENSVCGYSFLRCFPDLSINGPQFPESPYLSDYVSCRLNDGVKGDKAEVYKTKILSQYPFLEIPGESFLFEDYVWIQMAEKYKTVHLNIPIYIGDYLNDGLTKNINEAKIKNPVGMFERANIIGKSKAKWTVKFKAIIMFIVYGKIAKKTIQEMYINSFNKLFFLLFYIPSIVYLKLNVKRFGEE